MFVRKQQPGGLKELSRAVAVGGAINLGEVSEVFVMSLMADSQVCVFECVLSESGAGYRSLSWTFLVSGEVVVEREN